VSFFYSCALQCVAPTHNMSRRAHQRWVTLAMYHSNSAPNSSILKIPVYYNFAPNLFLFSRSHSNATPTRGVSSGFRSRERGTPAGSPFSGTQNAETHAGSPFPGTWNACEFAASMNPESCTHFRTWKPKTTCAFSFLVIQYVFLFPKTKSVF
jgi:hypothetical protein